MNEILNGIKVSTPIQKFKRIVVIPFFFCGFLLSHSCPKPSYFMPYHQILKLYAWEPSFQTQVEDIRESELKVMRKFAYLTSVSTFIFTCAPALVSFQVSGHRRNTAGLDFSSVPHRSSPPRCLWSRLQCLWALVLTTSWPLRKLLLQSPFSISSDFHCPCCPCS